MPLSSLEKSHAEKVAAYKARKQQEKIQSLPQRAVTPFAEVLPLPTIDGLLPDLIPPRPGDQINLLDRIKTTDDLKVTVGYDDNPLFSTTVSGTWDGDSSNVTTDTFPPGTPPENRVIFVRHHALTNGSHTFVARAVNDFIGDDTSPPVRVTIDLTPPNSGSSLQAIQFNADVLAGITTELLDRDGGITGTVPKWSDIARADRIQFTWARRTLAGTFEEPGIIVDEQVIDDPTLTITVNVPAAMIRSAGEGTFSLWYQVFDRAGNDAVNLSNFQTELVVNLTPLPVIPPISLDKYSNGPVITREDVYLQASVLIPEWAPWTQGDTADVYVGDLATPAIRGVPSTGGNLLIPLPFSVLEPFDGQTGIQVRARINRSNSQIGTNTNIILVEVDLAVPGPAPGPGEEGPENSNFLPVVVKSASWADSSDDNKLLPADVGKDATAEVELIDGFNSGEILELNWSGIADPVDTQPIGTATPGTIITFTVPWADIEAGDFGAAIPVYYKVVTTDPTDGYQQSVPTLVDSQLGGISDLGDLVATGKTLIPIPVQPPYSAYIINCNDAPWDGIKVDVPRSDGKFERGAIFALTFIGYDSIENPKEVDRETFAPYTLTQTDADTGFVYTIPYSDLVEATTPARAEIFYTITTPDGRNGSSNRVNLVIRRIDGGGNVCEATP